MVDDPSRSHAPPDLRQSALRDLAQGRTNRALFIEAMADPLRRGIAFDSWRETAASDLPKVKTA